jgi:hypothetical protein
MYRKCFSVCGLHALPECLDRCSKSSTPPGITIQGFYAELHEQGWTDEDVKIVQSTASRIVLQRIKDDEKSA